MHLNRLLDCDRRGQRLEKSQHSTPECMRQARAKREGVIRRLKENNP